MVGSSTLSVGGVSHLAALTGSSVSTRVVRPSSSVGVTSSTRAGLLKGVGGPRGFALVVA